MGHLDMLGTIIPKEILKDKNINSILIIGASLKSSMLNYFINENKYNITVMDISSWQIEQAELDKKPITILNEDALLHNDYNYDLVISFIMEHVNYEDAISLWNKITSQSKYSYFFVPDGEFYQEGFDENPYFFQITPNWNKDMILSDFSNIDNVEERKYHLIVSYTKK